MRREENKQDGQDGQDGKINDQKSRLVTMAQILLSEKAGTETGSTLPIVNG